MSAAPQDNNDNNVQRHNTMLDSDLQGRATIDNHGRRHNTMLDSDLQGRMTMMQMQKTNTPKQKSRISFMGKGRNTIFGKAHLWRHSPVISKEEQPEIPYGNGLDEEVVSYITTKLQSCFLFLSLSDTQMIDLATRFEVKEYEIGQHIIMQGSRTDCSRTTVVGTDIYFYLLAYQIIPLTI